MNGLEKKKNHVVQNVKFCDKFSTYLHNSVPPFMQKNDPRGKQTPPLYP